MTPSIAKRQWWRLATLSGTVLIALGVSAFYIDVAAAFRFSFIEHYYEAFGVCILVGTVVVFVGCVAWALFCDRKRRARMAGLVFITPLLALLVGSPIGGTSIHGPSAITMMLTIPSTLLAVVLLIMAARAPQQAT